MISRTPDSTVSLRNATLIERTGGSESRAGGEFYWTSSLVFLLLLVFYVLPPPARLAVGLDDSWRALLVELFLHHAQFGKDVIFTYGPWGFLREPMGDPAIFPWLIFGKLVFATAMSFGLVWLALALIRGRILRWIWLFLVFC